MLQKKAYSIGILNQGQVGCHVIGTIFQEETVHGLGKKKIVKN